MNSGSSLRIHQLGQHIHVLGPGTRFCIWTQGCMQRCPGCLAPDAQPLEGGYPISTEELARKIIADNDLDGITISGGEPFLQAEALIELLDMVHEKRNLGVILYTGYLLEDIQANVLPEAANLLKRIDLLIDGPYIETLNDNGALRGSSNQRILPLTDRYTTTLSQYGQQDQRRTELLTTEGNFFMAGVPSKATMKLIQRLSGRRNVE